MNGQTDTHLPFWRLFLNSFAKCVQKQYSLKILTIETLFSITYNASI